MQRSLNTKSPCGMTQKNTSFSATNRYSLPEKKCENRFSHKQFQHYRFLGEIRFPIERMMPIVRNDECGQGEATSRKKHRQPKPLLEPDACGGIDYDTR